MKPLKEFISESNIDSKRLDKISKFLKDHSNHTKYYNKYGKGDMDAVLYAFQWINMNMTRFGRDLDEYFDWIRDADRDVDDYVREQIPDIPSSYTPNWYRMLNQLADDLENL